MAESRQIVLTGATRGCGRALVHHFVKAGHQVHGCGRSPGLIAELQRSVGAPHTFHTVDVAEGAAVRTWADRILESVGAPGLVINNAGLINANAPLWDVSEDEFSDVVDVNLKGTASVLRAFLPAMIERRSGVVVNMSSGWGRSTAPDLAPYCATKWAIEGLSQAVAQEVPTGIAVVAVNPGIIHTAMLRSCFGDSARAYETPDVWAERAGPFLLQLGPRDNGRSASVP